MWNVQGTAPKNIDFHIYKSAWAGHNQIDRRGCQTCFLRLDNILIDVPFRVTGSHLLEHAVIEGLYALQRNRLTGESLVQQFSWSKSPGLAFNSQLQKTSRFIRQPSSKSQLRADSGRSLRHWYRGYGAFDVVRIIPSIKCLDNHLLADFWCKTLEKCAITNLSTKGMRT